MPDAEREAGLLALVARPRRARLKDQLASERGRAKLVDSLWHDPPFDERYITVLPHPLTSPEAVREALLRRGAPAECYAVATDAALDGRMLPLDEALASLDGAMNAAIMICVADRLAYYQGEPSNGGGYQWIVARDA